MHSTLGATAAGDGEFELRAKWSHGAYVDADSFDVRLRPQAWWSGSPVSPVVHVCRLLPVGWLLMI